MKKGVIIGIFLLLVISFEYGNLAQGQGDKGSFAVEKGDKFTYKFEVVINGTATSEADKHTLKESDSGALVTEGEKIKMEITAASADSVSTKTIYADDTTYDKTFTKAASTLDDEVLTTGWEYWKTAAEMGVNATVTEDSDTFSYEYQMIIMFFMKMVVKATYNKDNGVFEETHIKQTLVADDSLLMELKIVKTSEGDGLISGFTIIPLFFIGLIAVPVVYISRRR
ncbi:MAG: hypothetical protein ACFFCQ_07565 [Promethearchaeota archaeon]